MNNLRINNMNSEKMIITGIVAHGICSKCGTKRILYFTPDGMNMYGERVVSTRSGNHFAYVNLLSETIIPEIDDYCHQKFKEKEINYSETKIGRIVSDIYGVSCDKIENENVDTIPPIRCPNCMECTMVEEKEFGEQIQKIEMDNVTHDYWNSLSSEERKKRVFVELKRQRYI